MRMASRQATGTPRIVLGIPIDSLSMEEAIERIFQLVDDHAADGRPRLVCTVNTDFIVNTLRWSLWRSRHPELLEVLRGSDLVTADGMPVVWASRLLGPAIRERVTGADLVPRLAREAAVRGKSMYFLGGNPGSAERAARVLTERNPGLKTAGWDSPFVHTEGPGLIHAHEDDREIVERINASRPDILLIAFGNPKQEIWFNLNRHRRQVPVSIGVGGTFEFIAGSIRRAPGWMREHGLEWLFRFTQDPSRLWKRYLVDLAKFGLLVWPSILLHQCAKKASAGGEGTGPGGNGPVPFETRACGKALVVVLPGIVDTDAADWLVPLLPALPDTHLVLDAGGTTCVDSAGLAFLTGVLARWEERGFQVLVARMSGALRGQVIANRLGDLFAGRLCATMEEARARLDAGVARRDLCVEHREAGTACTIRISGDLKQAHALYPEAASLASQVHHPSCTVDLSGCTSVDTSGICFLLQLHDALVRGGARVTVAGPTGEARQMMRVARVDTLLMKP